MAAVLSGVLVAPRAAAEPAVELKPPATADEPREAPPPPVPPRYLDYRPHLLGLDLASLGLVAAAIAVNGKGSEALAWSSLGLYAFGAPLVHVAYEKPVRALASLGMRLGFPVAGGALGLLLAAPSCNSSTDDEGWRCVGAVIGLGGLGVVAGGLTAIIIDDAFLGKVELPPVAERRLSLTMAPLLDARARSVGLSVAGAF